MRMNYSEYSLNKFYIYKAGDRNCQNRQVHKKWRERQHIRMRKIKNE